MEEARRDRPEPRDLPADDLRADVRYLGSLLGTVLKEQGGDGLLAAVEQARHAAIELRDAERSEERRVGKECRSRWSPYH